MDIDFVITWVDMDEPAWREVYNRYAGEKGNLRHGTTETRFRDYGLLRYWFRGVDKFAPWVRKIHFVTSGQRPEWLDTTNPRLNMVDHKDFIPADYLPTFNSVVIERYMHRIPGLAEHFVYFNDDFFIIRPIRPQRFFREGLPCDIAAFQYSPAFSQFYVTLKNNIRLINRHFDKREVLARDAGKWFDKSYGSKLMQNYLFRRGRRFTTLCVPHNAQPYLKSTFQEVWEACGTELAETSANRFRAYSDYTPELFRTWQICSGNFSPYNTYKDTKMFPLVLNPKQAVEAIRNQAYSLVCINDHSNVRDYEGVIASLRAAFEEILPDKSSFEI